MKGGKKSVFIGELDTKVKEKLNLRRITAVNFFWELLRRFAKTFSLGDEVAGLIEFQVEGRENTKIEKSLSWGAFLENLGG